MLIGFLWWFFATVVTVLVSKVDFRQRNFFPGSRIQGQLYALILVHCLNSTESW
jgi:hypothetical protein